MDKMYPKSKQTEGAISSLFMYLYQSYIEEQGLSPEQAKAKVVETIEEGINKFEGNDNKKESNKNKSMQENPKVTQLANGLAINTITDSLKRLKQSCYYKNLKYLVDAVEFNFNKLVENNNLK